VIGRLHLAALGSAALTLIALAGCGSSSSRGTGLPPAPTTQQLLARAALPPCPSSTTAPGRPDGLPELTLPCLGSGPAVRLAGLRGTPTLLNVWAPWCGPCKQEVPLLASLQQRTGPRLRVLGLVFEDDRRDSLDASRGLGIHYPSVLDHDGLSKAALAATGVPQSYLVDAQGRVVYHHPGPFHGQAELDAAVGRYLGVS
jgi:cytochrome c biogenesis protein CcmG, thiol:disulfide interchange protein DsbE